MNEKYKNVPKRRFKTFKDAEAWEPCKLGDILSLENGFAFKSKFFQEESSSTIVLTPGNVAIGGGFQTDKGRYYNDAGILPKQFIFKPGDTFVTMTDLTPSAQTLGFPAIVPNDGIKYLHNQRLGKIVSYDCNNLFLFYLLCTHNYHKYIVSTASGTTVKHTSPERILDYNCYIPKNDEQFEIARYFRKIDNLITLHQSKLNKMNELKKAYLNDMFPVKEECKPKLRFAGFTDDWKPCNLGDTIDISTNMVDPKSGCYDDLPHIGPGNIEAFTGRLLDNVKTVKEDCLISGKFHFNKGDVIYGKINPQLSKCVYAPYEGLASADAYVLNAKNGLEQAFLFALLQTQHFFSYSVSVSMRSGMPKINRDELNAYSFMVPCVEEQLKIGNIFLTLDKNIHLHQNKLKKLQNIKKAYLKEIFI